MMIGHLPKLRHPYRSQPACVVFLFFVVVFVVFILFIAITGAVADPRAEGVAS
jgi:hypothetical protein